jgi:hypothetical protein
MRLSADEHGPEEIAKYDVYVDGELIPHHAIVEVNKEAFYALLYRLDSHGSRVYRILEGAHPGQCRHELQTYMRYGQVQIIERKP